MPNSIATNINSILYIDGYAMLRIGSPPKTSQQNPLRLGRLVLRYIRMSVMRLPSYTAKCYHPSHRGTSSKLNASCCSDLRKKKIFFRLC